MRLWSLHPRYLDPQGLVALWREALLARAVLRGETRGYRHHPQLDRFRDHASPRSAISQYLSAIHAEASSRGYAFDRSKVGIARSTTPIAVTEGQLEFEWGHLLKKLSVRSPEHYRRWRSLRSPGCHPLFRCRPGAVEPWERGASAQLPPWTCPRCRRRFANRNQTHTCGRSDLAHHFRGKDPYVRRLYDAVRTAVRRCGPVTILPEKTRIAFQVRMSFAQVTPRTRWLDGHLVLARRLEHDRFRKVETFSPRNHVHHFRLTTIDQIDSEFQRWLQEAYAVGAQEHLPPRRARS